MATIDTQLTHGASNGGVIFRDRGSPCSRTKGARPVVPVDVTGLPVGAGGGRLDPRASATACYTPIALGCDVGGVHRSAHGHVDRSRRDDAPRKSLVAAAGR
jgi:hypothetical protein